MSSWSTTNRFSQAPLRWVEAARKLIHEDIAKTGKLYGSIRCPWCQARPLYYIMKRMNKFITANCEGGRCLMWNDDTYQPTMTKRLFMIQQRKKKREAKQKLQELQKQQKPQRKRGRKPKQPKVEG